MSRSVVSSIVLSLVLVLGAAAQAPPALTILRAGRTGELSQLEQGNEIRVVFSEPMVALGRIPARVEAPFVGLVPPAKGSFRWSVTTILISTPDPGDPLPSAPVFTVTIDRTARAVSGRQLAAPYTFESTTPTTRLLRLERQRAQNRYDRPVLLYLRFNQPVDAKAILPHVRVQLAPYAWQPPQLSPAAEARLGRLDPIGLKQFRAKVAAVTAATRSSAAVPVRIAAKWDVKAYPSSPDLVVLETLTVPPPQTQLQITLDRALPSPQGRATPSRDQQLVEPLEPAFFVLG